MTLRQVLQFRQVYRRTGCLAAALAAAGLVRGRRGGRACPVRRKAPVETQAGLDLEQALAALESEAVRRALSGVSLPVYHQGRLCGSTTKHSDQLLVFLLKTLRPGRYGAAGENPEAGEDEAGPLLLELDLSAADAEAGNEEG